MGIRNLHTFLRARCPEIYKKVSLTQFAFKTFAIDLSIYLCRYKVLYKDKWIDAFLHLITHLRENEIHFVFVFDSKSPPEKDEEKRQRMIRREKMRKRVEDMERGLKLLLEKNIMTESLTRFSHPHQRQEDCVHTISKEIDRLKSHLFDIHINDFHALRELFDILGVPHINAVSEAEQTCTYFCQKGCVDAVLTEDTDVLAYGVPMYISKIDLMENTVTCILLSDVLDALRLTSTQFKDFCIMCGTDYNTNMSLVGPERAYKYIVEYKTLDAMIPHMNTDVLKFPRVRQLLSTDHMTLPPQTFLCRGPDMDKLGIFCFTHNCVFDIRRLERACTETSCMMTIDGHPLDMEVHLKRVPLLIK
jgi:5'-3' exonuclease